MYERYPLNLSIKKKKKTRNNMGVNNIKFSLRMKAKIVWVQRKILQNEKNSSWIVILVKSFWLTVFFSFFTKTCNVFSLWLSIIIYIIYVFYNTHIYIYFIIYVILYYTYILCYIPSVVNTKYHIYQIYQYKYTK